MSKVTRFSGRSPWLALTVVIVAGLVFTACGGDDAATTTASAVKRLDLKEAPFDAKDWLTNDKPTKMGSPLAKRGGMLRWPIQEYPATLRPVGPKSSSVFIRMVGNLVWETLIGIDSITMAWTPSLASHWKISDDKQTFTFRIDKRARWSDGQEVTAEDVLETWRFLVDPVIKDPFQNSHWKKFEEPKILSKYVVEVKAKEKVWRSLLSIGAGMQIFPAHVLKGEENHKAFLRRWQLKMMPGTGPYSLEHMSNGKDLTMRRRKDYWGDLVPANRGTNNFERIKFIVVRDLPLMFEKFKKGELDWYHVIVARRWARDCDFDKVEKGWIQKRRIWTHKPQGISGLAFNTREWPFDDIRVRKAFAYAYNRQQLIDKLFFKQYFHMDSLYPNSVYASPENEIIRFDLKKAEQLLSEAGYKQRDAEGWLIHDKTKKRLELDLSVTDQSGERIQTVFQEDLKKIGVKLNLKRATMATIWKLMHEYKFKLTSIAWSGLLFPNPESSFHSKFADPENTNNIYGLKDPEVDKLIEEYNASFDVEHRKKLMQELDHKLFLHHLYALGWYAPYDRVLYWNKFGYPDYYFSRFSDYRSIISLWWIDPAKEEEMKKAMASDASMKIGPVEVKFWEDFKASKGENFKKLEASYGK